MPRWEGKPEDRALTMKQVAFIDEWEVNGFNGGKAAWVANYALHANNRTLACRVQACDTLSKANVKKEIARRKALTVVKTGITIASVVADLRLLADHCLGKQHLLDGKDPVIDAAGAKGALELLGKHTGAFEQDNSQRADKTVIVISQEQA